MKHILWLLPLLITSPLLAETAWRAADGQLYLMRNGTPPSFELITIVDIGTNTPDTPGDPTPPTPTTDKWGLTKLSKQLADSITPYAGIEKDRESLAAFYWVVAGQVDSGAITNEVLPDGRTKIQAALDLAFSVAVGTHAKNWDAWDAQVSLKFDTSPINSAVDAAQGIRDISNGLVAQDARSAIDWQILIDLFLKILIAWINGKFGI